MSNHISFSGLLLIALLTIGCGAGSDPAVTGELMVWHAVTLTLAGPETSESAEVNPYTDYRLDATFTGPAGQALLVPGYYAADGAGGEAGNQWRVTFVPDEPGEWEYQVSFLHGPNVAVNPNAPSEAVYFHGANGTVAISASDKQGRDFRAQGMLEYAGERYLKFAGSGQYFLKGGADSPENFLAYEDFDGTRDNGETKIGPGVFLHKYKPHVKDWREGDPTWRDGKGKGIIGGLNYLASEGVNSIYFLTQNVNGDGNDVWPWTGPEDFLRYDVSKLDQWEIVFQHAQRNGIMLHVLTAEAENDRLLDGGELGPERKLYYRELIARFGHHLALIWNLGEENHNTDAQIKAFSRYIHEIDPYDHPVVMHTNSTPEWHEKKYAPLLGYEYFEGASMQIRDDEIVHDTMRNWIRRSGEAGRQWIVAFDEQRTGSDGVEPDSVDPWHDDARNVHLWASLLAGGWGIEWYFGYMYDNSDTNLEDWRSRDNLWDITRWALEFFHAHLPFWEMDSRDELTPATDDYVLAKPGEVYAIYVPQGGTARLNLEDSEGNFTVRWFNPRAGGDLVEGSAASVSGPGVKPLGKAPEDLEADWVVLVKKD
jgi:uncharacterized protein DUF5060/collagenase-like protein with putative collagen-binding domain